MRESIFWMSDTINDMLIQIVTNLYLSPVLVILSFKYKGVTFKQKEKYKEANSHNYFNLILLLYLSPQ
jgi:hypothetical protein